MGVKGGKRMVSSYVTIITSKQKHLPDPIGNSR